MNPSTDDNYPTVNMEAIACGLPVLIYDTGGCAEIIDNKSGLSVPSGDYESLKKDIIRIHDTKPFTKQDCLKGAKSFNMNDKYDEYIKLYNDILL